MCCECHGVVVKQILLYQPQTRVLCKVPRASSFDKRSQFIKRPFIASQFNNDFYKIIQAVSKERYCRVAARPTRSSLCSDAQLLLSQLCQLSQFSQFSRLPQLSSTEHRARQPFSLAAAPSIASSCTPHLAAYLCMRMPQSLVLCILLFGRNAPKVPCEHHT